MNGANWERFSAAYGSGLMKAVNDRPDEFFYGPDGVPVVVKKMLTAIESAGTVKAVNFASVGFRNACRELKISHTAKAMDAFIRGE